jgi:hypothetical protein
MRSFKLAAVCTLVHSISAFWSVGPDEGDSDAADTEVIKSNWAIDDEAASTTAPISTNADGSCAHDQIWEMMSAGNGKWNCATGEWEMAGCTLAPEAQLPSIACPVLTAYDKIVFHGDSVIRQFYQGTLIQLSGDREFGSLQGAEMTWAEKLQWTVPENPEGINYNHDWVNPPPAHCKGLDNQFLKTGWSGEREGVGCGDGVACGNCYLHLANTTGQQKFCGGGMSASFFWAWNAECEGAGECLAAHIAHTRAALAAGKRVLLVTGIGLHDDCNPEKTYAT